MKTIKFLSVRRTDISNILSVRPIFYRPGNKSPKIIGNFLSVRRTDKFNFFFGNDRIFVGFGPTVFIFSVSLKAKKKFKSRCKISGNDDKGNFLRKYCLFISLLCSHDYRKVSLFNISCYMISHVLMKVYSMAAIWAYNIYYGVWNMHC